VSDEENYKPLALTTMQPDAMSNRLSDAMSKLNVDSSRNSMGRPPPSPGNKRNSGLDPSTINAMFPDAAAAIAQKKAEYAQQAANAPSNCNSAAFGERASFVTPTISAPGEGGKEHLPNHLTSSSWRSVDPQPPISRPKSSSGPQQPPMGQFAQPPPSAGLRSPRPPPSASSTIQNTTLNAPENIHTELPALSPYNIGNSSWASMSNTPMVPNFSSQQQNVQNDMIANATAMKLAALSTVTNRIALDDVRKYRRARSNEPQPHIQQGSSGTTSNTGIPGANMVVVNDQGQILNAQQLAALQQQQLAAHNGRRSRPNSPGMAMQGAGMGQLNFPTPQNNGFLAAYDGTSPMMSNSMGGMMGQYGAGTHEGYLSDHSEMARGRSPRGRRGSSKPPEDPTDPNLLQDIPTWLRSLRLHKYTDNLKDLKWDELVQLDEKGLEARGVNAQGARNKMLKVPFPFATVATH
jgi:SAM domain (Sterile alpha motif)